MRLASSYAPRNRLLWPALLLLLAGVALTIGWVGFIASDDSLYHAGALRWLTDGPSPGADHWSTRFPLVLSFAALIWMMGPGFAAFGTVSVLWYGALVAVAGGFAARIGGGRAGWIAAVLIATMPVVVSHASTVSCDLAEAFFLVAGAWAVSIGSGADRRALLLGAFGGICFGLAILCRETALLALAAFGPLFLLGRPLNRQVLIAAGLGMAVVLGGEMLFQFARTGDPLHRYALAVNHDEHIDRAANLEGNFLVHPVVDPLLVLLVNDDFGLLFWLAGAALACGAMRGLQDDGRRRLIVAAAMAASNFLLVALLYHKLVLNPRYFTLPALVAAFVVALWLARMRARTSAMLIAALVTTNLLLLSVGNAHPRWGVEALLLAARAYPKEIVHADPDTVARAYLPLHFGRIGNVQPGATGLVLTDRAPLDPALIVARYPSPPTHAGALIQSVRLQRLVPAAIRRRLFTPSAEQFLVRR